MNEVEKIALDQIERVESLRRAYLGLECALCKKKKVIISHRAEWFDVKREPLLVCNSCGVEVIRRLREKTEK